MTIEHIKETIDRELSAGPSIQPHTPKALAVQVVEQSAAELRMILEASGNPGHPLQLCGKTEGAIREALNRLAFAVSKIEGR